MEIFFRVDSNPEIGAGHFERCLVLANSISQENDITFIYKDLTINQKKLAKHKFKFIKINNSKKINDANQTYKIVKRNSYLIIDGYNFKRDFINKIKKKTSNIFINNDFEVDTFGLNLVNPSDVYFNFKKRKFGIPIIKRNLNVINLREHFKRIKKNNTILLSFGASDRENYTEKILLFLSSKTLKNYKILVLIGELNKNYDLLKKKFKNKKNVQFIKNENNIKNVFDKSSFCILAGGVISREANCFGLPGLVLKVSKNQDKNIRFFKKNKIFPCRDIQNINKKNFVTIIKKEIRNFDFKKFLYNMSYSQYDFLERYLFLLQTSSPKARLRQVSWKDFLFLYNMAKDNRKNSFSKSKIDIYDHYKWFKKKISSRSTKIYILNLNNLRIGQVRLDKRKKIFFLDYSINNFFQGYGYGEKIIKLILLKFRNYPTEIYANVLKHNKKSIKIMSKICISKFVNKNYIKFKLK